MGSQASGEELENGGTMKTSRGISPASDRKQKQDASLTGESFSARGASPAADKSNGATPMSDKQLLDAECERLLRNTKRQVKQMMEEAVTRKFIHEESSSIISLCVCIDACLSHQLKRRALGLFKTNSSTALVRKIAKACPEAQSTISMAEREERRLQDELNRQKKQHQSSSVEGSTSSKRVSQGQARVNTANSPVKQVASNSSVHRRNMWIKCALIEKKLVPIVEHLAANASQYYEPEALMANCVSAQLLCSLLVGPCALEFSRSKTNDFYQFEEPSADELLKRHKLSNPIACLCSSMVPRQTTTTTRLPSEDIHYARSPIPQHDGRYSVSRSFSTTVGRNISCVASRGRQHSRRLLDDQTQLLSRSLPPGHNLEQSSPGRSGNVVARGLRRRSLSASQNEELGCDEESLQQQASNSSSITGSTTVLKSSAASKRHRPLALRNNIKTGALVTECHHSACQEISSHRQTRGYSFTSTPNANLSHPPPSSQTHHVLGSSSNGCNAGARHEPQSNGVAHHAPEPKTQPLFGGQVQPTGNSQEGNWPAWSPRMLHETLHQNSRSSLLYAKNNVLLETQAQGSIAGYLSLHQTSTSDLVLKWIPNQLINGGHTQEATHNCLHHHPTNKGRLQAHSTSESTHASSDMPTGSCDSVELANTNCASGRRAPVSTSGFAESEMRSHSLSCADVLNKPPTTEQEAASQKGQSQDSPEVPFVNQPRAVGSSYLDLVISLSVSRIVLLHCHFNGVPTSEFFTAANEHFSPNETSECTNQSDDSKPNSDLEETLVLVEADGIQRAPFRFPKGGLRWFLSCLENGLGPARYLEPAIRPDEHDYNDERRRQMTDPLHMLEWPNHGCSSSDPHGGMDSPSCANGPASAPLTSNSTLGGLLRRLPSLRRTHASVTKEKSCPSADVLSTRDDASGSGVATAEQQESNKKLTRPVNYVYRIVSAHQIEWPQQTSPLSALSIDSSSSGSFLTMGASYQPRPPLSESANASKRFSWSLNKLARFSSRNNSNCLSATSASGQGLASRHNSTAGSQTRSTSTLGSLTSLLYLSYNKTTLDSASSQDSSQQMPDQNGTGSCSAANNSIIKRDSSLELIRIEAKLSDLKKSSTEELAVLRNQSVQNLCESMRKQILGRAFYGWLVYCRRMKIVRTHLKSLISESRLAARRKGMHWNGVAELDVEEARQVGLTWERWREFQSRSSTGVGEEEIANAVNHLVYYGGIEDDRLRAEVWPYLLGHYKFGDSPETRRKRDAASRDAFESRARDWVQIEQIIKERDNEILAANMAKVARRQRRERLMANAESGQEQNHGFSSLTSETTDQDSTEFLQEDEDESETQPHGTHHVEDELEEEQGGQDKENGNGGANHDLINQGEANDGIPSSETIDKNEHKKDRQRNTGPSAETKAKARRQRRMRRRFRLESTGSVGSDASLTDQFGNNIHRIDKDVQRCDRNFWYFKSTENLDKLRKIMCSYVWQHLDVGYVQGMCDLAAPLLVIFDHDEFMAFNCFSQLMKRMVANFPHGTAMDQHFEHLKYLMQVLDPKLFEILQNNGDYTHFYFCYRWLLLDFKRELAYEDVYRVWEAIWSARFVATEHFVVFLALAMVRFYRDIIIENNMDFTDTIKFFNEMAERHDARKIIALAQDCVMELESLIDTQP